MEQHTRNEVAGALQLLRSGLAILEGLAEHVGSDLTPAEREALLAALDGHVHPGIEAIGRVMLQAQQRAPKGRRGNLRPEVA